jgi:hypothetical protein
MVGSSFGKLRRSAYTIDIRKDKNKLATFEGLSINTISLDNNLISLNETTLVYQEVLKV